MAERLPTQLASATVALLERLAILAQHLVNVQVVALGLGELSIEGIRQPGDEAVTVHRFEFPAPTSPGSVERSGQPHTEQFGVGGDVEMTTVVAKGTVGGRNTGQ
jgi:hypothetical protein